MSPCVRCRSLLERLFRDLQRAFVENPQTTIAVLSMNAKISQAVASDTASMTQYDRLLQCATIKNALWIFLGISASVQYPQLDGKLLYGALSDGVHLPDTRFLYLPDNVALEILTFFESLANIYKKKIVLVSPGEAAAGSEEESI